MLSSLGSCELTSHVFLTENGQNITTEYSNNYSNLLTHCRVVSSTQTKTPLNMGWPYEFLTLSDEEKHQRRLSLNYYAWIAHLSAFAPALLFIIARIVNRVRRGGSSGYSQVPGSPGVKANRQRWISRAMGKGPMVQWWLGEDVWFLGSHWGQRDEWVLGITWTIWLLVLSIHGTGKGMYID